MKTIIIRALLFLAKTITRSTFKKDFESLDECLDYLNKNSYIKKYSYFSKFSDDRWINSIGKTYHIEKRNYILTLWNLIYKKKIVILDWGGGVSNSSLYLDPTSTIYVLDRPELISKLKRKDKKKNVLYISKLEEIPKKKRNKINLFYFGSSVQYLNINEVINQTFKLMPIYLVFTHNLYTKEKKTFYTIQNNIDNEQIPYCIYNYISFINFFKKKYDVIKVISSQNPYTIKSKNYKSSDMNLTSIILRLKNTTLNEK